jgi:hypothetical protein
MASLPSRLSSLHQYRRNVSRHGSQNPTSPLDAPLPTATSAPGVDRINGPYRNLGFRAGSGTAIPYDDVRETRRHRIEHFDQACANLLTLVLYYYIYSSRRIQSAVSERRLQSRKSKDSAGDHTRKTYENSNSSCVVAREGELVEQTHTPKTRQ